MFDDSFSCPLAQARALSHDRCAQPNHGTTLHVWKFSRGWKISAVRANVFQRYSSNTAKCLLSGKCTFNCTSKSKRATLGSRGYIATRSLPFFFSRALSPYPPFFCHLYPSPSHTSSFVFFFPFVRFLFFLFVSFPFPPLSFPSLFRAFLSQVFISTLLPPPPFPSLFFIFPFLIKTHTCALLKFVHKVQRVHTLFLLVTLFHSWLFSLLSHLFPVSDRFRNTIVIPPPPLFLPARSFNAPILPFVIYATGHRFDLQLCFPLPRGRQKKEVWLLLHSSWIIRRFRNIVSNYLLNRVEGFFELASASR